MTRSPHSAWLLNTLGFLAYLSCLIQWAFVMLPFVPGVVDSEIFHTFVVSDRTEPSVSVASPQLLPDWLAFVFVIVVAVAIIAVTVLALVRMPRAVGKTGQKITHSAAEQVLPIITHHVKLPEKKRRALTARIVFDIKLALVTLPLLIVLIAPAPAMVVAPQLFTLIAALVAGWSLLLFCVQAVLARALRVPLDHLW